MSQISIIIPVYNLANPQIRGLFDNLIKHLSIAISQTDRNLFDKIIVINDKPEDIISDVVEEIFVKHELKVLLLLSNNPQTQGQAATRNRGAELAKGNYLHFIDQDDYINSNFYSSFLDSEKRDITIGLPVSYYLDADSLFYPYRTRLIRLYSKTKYIKNLKWLLVSNIAVSPGQYIISRETFFNNGMFPDLIHKGCDDYGMLFNLSKDKHCSVSFNSSMRFFYTIHKRQNRKSHDMNASLTEFYNSLNKSELTLWHKFVTLRTNQFFSGLFKILVVLLFIKRPR